MYEQMLKDIDRMEKISYLLKPRLHLTPDLILLNNIQLNLAYLGRSICKNKIKELSTVPAHISPELTHKTEK